MMPARYGWCRKSSVASNSTCGAPVRAATSSALRAAFATASACGTARGSARRAASVASGSGGTHATALRVAGTPSRSSRAPAAPPLAAPPLAAPPLADATTGRATTATCRAGPRRPCDGEPAGQAGRHIVRMTFQCHGELEERLVRERGLPRNRGLTAAAQGTGRQQAAADRRGRRAEPPAVRYRVRTAQGDARRLAAHRAERSAHGPDNQVLLACRGGAAALAGHLDRQPAAGDAGLDLIVEPQRQAQRVEPGPQVGAGGGRTYPGRPLRPDQAAPPGDEALPKARRSCQPQRGRRGGRIRRDRHRGRARPTPPSPGPSARCR